MLPCSATTAGAQTGPTWSLEQSKEQAWVSKDVLNTGLDLATHLQVIRHKATVIMMR